MHPHLPDAKIEAIRRGRLAKLSLEGLMHSLQRSFDRLKTLFPDSQDFTIKPVCAYSVKGQTNMMENIKDETFGMLFFAEVFSFQEIHSEIEKILITDNLIENLTYPLIQPQLIKEAKNRGYL